VAGPAPSPVAQPPFAEVRGDVRLAGNRPRMLDVPGELLWIAYGEVDVFWVRVEDGSASGARHHLLRAGPGQALFGLDLADAQAAGLGLLAVSVGEANLVRVSLDAWRGSFARSETQASALESVARWVSGVSAGLTLRPHRPDAVRAAVPDRYQLQAGASITPASGVLCAQVEEGTAFFTGEMDLPVDAGGAPVLLCPDTWVETSGGCVVRMESLAGAVAAHSLPGLLAGFHRLALQALDLRTLLEEVREEARLMARDQSLQQTFERTLAGHARVLEHKDSGPTAATTIRNSAQG
jgi:hypothetical protein